MSFSGTVSSPEQPGGGEETFSFVGGVVSDQASVTFTYEHQERGIIFLADNLMMLVERLQMETMHHLSMSLHMHIIIG